MRAVAVVVAFAIVSALALLGGGTCGRRAEEGSAAPGRSAAEEIGAERGGTAAVDERPRHGLLPDEAARVVARIDDREITALDVADELAARHGILRTQSLMPAQRGVLIDELIDEELLADEARRRGHDHAPEVVAARREALTRALGAAAADELDVPAPTEGEIRVRYERDNALFRRPELARARVMVLRDRETATSALAQLRAAPRLENVWQRLSTEHGWHAPMLDASGELGPFAHPDLARPEDAHVPRLVALAAFTSPVNTIHPELVEVDRLFYVVWPIAREPAASTEYAEARDRIAEELRIEALAAELEQMALGGREITIDDDALADVIDPWQRADR